MEVNEIQMKKSLGSWKPDLRLSNLAIAYYEEPTYAHKRIFPVCPVPLPSGHFYEFSKADLARDNVHQKPPYGSVQPAIFGISQQSYSCKVYQTLIGLDKIMALPYQREGGAFDPVRARVKTLTEQISLHQERDFAEKFFKASAWSNVWTGAATANPAQKQFKKFDSDSSDPTALFETLAIEIKREGRRRPNKLALGVETYAALRNNPTITERIKYSGTAQNPAIITTQVLAQMFGVEQVVVLDATYNSAKIGAKEKMEYVCDSKGALLLYAPENVRIDEPSAGMIFSWTLNGNDYIAVEQIEGAPASHVDLLEGLIAYDMKKTSDALAIYLADCVG